MKIVKMSLVAALLVGSSAFAVENIKMSGNVDVFCSTTDAVKTNAYAIAVNGEDGTLFDKDSSAADIGLNLNISADLAKNDFVTLSAGAGYTVLSTLGLENNFVGNVWGSAHTATASLNPGTGTGASYAGAVDGAKVENASWFNEAWVAATAGKSTVKLGRMELDTPLAFTEKWSIEKNTFEAAVLINQDIPDTTLVAAFIGNGNGTEEFGQNTTNNTSLASNVADLGLAVGGVVNANGDFGTYGTDGAYAVGVINNSVEPLTLQAWYYDVSRLAQAYWLQADLNVGGILAGAQYTAIDLSDYVDYTLESDAYAVMLGYEMKDMFTAKVAYSEVGKDHSVGFNTATATGTAQSKLYTETQLNTNFGNVTAAEASAINLTVESPVQGIVDLGLYVTMVDHAADNSDLTEVALSASKTFGPLDATLAYYNTDTDGGDSENTVRAMLTVNF